MLLCPLLLGRMLKVGIAEGRGKEKKQHEKRKEASLEKKKADTQDIK